METFSDLPPCWVIAESWLLETLLRGTWSRNPPASEGQSLSSSSSSSPTLCPEQAAGSPDCSSCNIGCLQDTGEGHNLSPLWWTARCRKRRINRWQIVCQIKLQSAPQRQQCRLVNIHLPTSFAPSATSHSVPPSYLCVWRCRSQRPGHLSTAVCSSLCEGAGRTAAPPLTTSPPPDSAGTQSPSPLLTPPGEHTGVFPSSRLKVTTCWTWRFLFLIVPILLCFSQQFASCGTKRRSRSATSADQLGRCYSVASLCLS